MTQRFGVVVRVAVHLVIATCFLLANADAQSNLTEPLTVRVAASYSPARFTRIALQPTGFAAFNVTAKELLKYAYGVRSYALVGAPEWLEAARFDVQVLEPQAGTASLTSSAIQEHRKLLVRNVLAGTFQLRFHIENRQVAGYSLATGDSHLRFSKHDPLFWSAARILNQNGHIEMTALPMSSLADELSDTLGAPVVDRTGLTGDYDLDFSWSTTGRPESMSDTYEGMAAALRYDVGLKLVSTQETLHQFVIDHIGLPHN